MIVPASTINPDSHAALVLTCEHACCAVPAEYDDLGLQTEELQEHIGWDIGAGHVTSVLADTFEATAVLAGVSRLVIDCNRDLADVDLIVRESHGTRIPGNTDVDEAERQRRIRDFYEPYHGAIEAVLASRRSGLLLSVHSFTPVLNGRARRFDVGVIFDQCAAQAQRLSTALSGDGLRVRYNQPYSGLDGLIFSAREHGTRHRMPYLEIEINNALLRTEPEATAMAARLAAALRTLL